MKTSNIMYRVYSKQGQFQGLVIDEETGRNVALTYEKEDAPVIARALNAHDGLVKALKLLVEMEEDPVRFIACRSYRFDMARTALAKAEEED